METEALRFKRNLKLIIVSQSTYENKFNMQSITDILISDDFVLSSDLFIDKMFQNIYF